MKKLLAIALALTMMLGLTAAFAQAPVELLIWEADGPEGEFIKAAAAKFTEKNPHITFRFEGVSHTDSVQKLELDGPTGAAADVYAAPHDKLGQIIIGQLALPLDAETTKIISEDFAGAALKAVSSEGVSYGYPTAIETYALFYNKALVEKAPETWDDIIAFAKTYNDVKENKFALVWETGNAYYDYMFLSAYGADLFGPEGTDKAQHMINSPEAIKGVEYFQGLKDQILPVKAEDMTGDFCNAAFTNTKSAAMWITGPWSIKGTVDAGVDLGIVALPKFPGRETPPTSFSGVRAMFVSSFSQHPEEAKAFASFLLTNEIQTMRSNMTSTISPRNDVKSENVLFTGINAQAQYAKPMPSIPAMDGYWSSMGSAYSNIWNGSPIEPELNNAAQVVEATP